MLPLGVISVAKSGPAERGNSFRDWLKDLTSNTLHAVAHRTRYRNDSELLLPGGRPRGR